MVAVIYKHIRVDSIRRYIKLLMKFENEVNWILQYNGIDKTDRRSRPDSRSIHNMIRAAKMEIQIGE